MTDAFFPASRGASRIDAGEFAGWSTWLNDPYECHNGPFAHRADDGRIRCAFRAEQRHLNGHGSIHGGCLTTFADYCLFAIAARELGDGPAVTLTLNTEFVGAGRQNDLVEGFGEIVKAGRSILFVRGIIQVGVSPLALFSGTIKRLASPATSR